MDLVTTLAGKDFALRLASAAMNLSSLIRD